SGVGITRRAANPPYHRPLAPSGTREKEALRSRHNTRTDGWTPMTKLPGHRCAFLLAALAATLLAQPAGAEDFYAGKSITLIVGSGVGGGYDLQGRLAARHLGKHIPGHPAMIVQNMPAAGGMAACNYLYSSAPQDGTVIALPQRNVLVAKLIYPG